MKSNSCSKTAALTLLTALVVGAWPTTGRSQDSSRRDRERYRREFTDRQSSARPGTGRPATPSSPTRPEATRPGATAQPGTANPQTARPGTTGAVPSASKDGQAGQITKTAEPSPAPRPSERRSSPRTNRPEQWTKYSIILERNMFSRDRRPVRLQEVVEERPRVVPNPESYFLLKGIAQEDNQFIAFVEDKRTGTVLRLREGDTVARGLVKSLNLDVLQYQFQDKAISVSMGSDLEGGSGALTAGDLASFSSMAAPATSSTGSAAPSADDAEILKRLMEQRQQQMGQ